MPKQSNPEDANFLAAAETDEGIERDEQNLSLQEIALLDEVSQLPQPMQAIYMQLLATIDEVLQRLRPAGATPGQLSEEFIERLVNRILDEDMEQSDLESAIEQEFQRQILLSQPVVLPC